MLGWLLPTIGGKSLHLNQEINILYLTHLEIRGSLPSSERLELFRAMVDKIWKLKFRRNFHLVSLIKFDAVFLDQALSKSGFLYEKVDGTLYQVLHNKNIEQQMLPPLKSAPAFEVGLA